MLVRFVFRYLIKGLRTSALRKRHSASFLAADRKRRKKQALAFSFLGATPSLPSGKNRTKKEWSPPTILDFFTISEGEKYYFPLTSFSRFLLKFVYV